MNIKVYRTRTIAILLHRQVRRTVLGRRSAVGDLVEARRGIAPLGVAPAFAPRAVNNPEQRVWLPLTPGPKALHGDAYVTAAERPLREWGVDLFRNAVTLQLRKPELGEEHWKPGIVSSSPGMRSKTWSGVRRSISSSSISIVVIKAPSVEGHDLGVR